MESITKKSTHTQKSQLPTSSPPALTSEEESSDDIDFFGSSTSSFNNSTDSKIDSALIVLKNSPNKSQKSLRKSPKSLRKSPKSPRKSPKSPRKSPGSLNLKRGPRKRASPYERKHVGIGVKVVLKKLTLQVDSDEVISLSSQDELSDQELSDQEQEDEEEDDDDGEEEMSALEVEEEEEIPDKPIEKQITFTDMAELESHLVSVCKNGQFNCTRCKDGVDFKSRAAMVNHMTTAHVNDDTYECALCELLFLHYSELAVHSKLEHSFDGYRCCICGKFYQIESQLTAHEDKCIEDGDAKLFKCMWCDDSFSNTRHLSEHSVTAHSYPGYTCSVCRLYFNVYDVLVKHKGSHSPEELTAFPDPFQVENIRMDQEEFQAICSEANSKPSVVVVQETPQVIMQPEPVINPNPPDEESDDNDSIDDTEKPLSCALCDSTFNRNHHLSKHSKLVHSLVGFNCEVCDIFFQIESVFKDHKSVHPELDTTKEVTPTDNLEIKSEIISSKSASDCELTNETSSLTSESNIDDMDHAPSADTKDEESVPPAVSLPDSETLGRLYEEFLKCNTVRKLMKKGPNNDVPQSAIGQLKENKQDDKSQGNESKKRKVDMDDQTSCSSSETIDYEHTERDYGLVKDVEGPIQVTSTEALKDRKKLPAESTGHSKSDNIPNMNRKAEFNCKLCNKVLDSPKVKILHEKKCRRKCTFCDKMFDMPYQTESHETIVHTGNYIICQVCSRMFSNNQSFKAHMRHHNDANRYNCELCGKVFAYQGSYKQHLIAIHTEARPYTCVFCGTSFKLPKQLKKHEDLHKGVKVDCKFCGKGFQTDHQKNKHVQDVHTGRKHICKYCGKAFLNKDPLRDHERTHTGEKPFKCPHCDACFNRQHHVTQHLKRHLKGTV